MHRKQIKTSRYVSAFAITIVIFLLGFISGGEINEHKLQRIYDLENDIRVESLGNELVFEMISSDLCENVNTTTYTTEITKLGEKLTYMEQIYGYDSAQVHNLKNYYTLLLTRHWIINKEMVEKCNLTKPNVLYFYTNFGDCVDCEDQGLVITNTHRKFPYFNIYAFEFREDNPAINFLKEKFVLSENRLPTVIIDGDVHYGFQSKNTLIEEMNLTGLHEEYLLKEEAKKSQEES
jgi:hypothetical protein